MNRPARRNAQIVRQWRVLRRLEAAPATVTRLADDLGVVARTIRRDLDALGEAGFPVYDDDNRRWHLLTKGVTPPRMES
jgi:predicted DNA-binding transcriptional regulator YafY